MIKFEDVLSIAHQIAGHSGFDLATIEYDVDRNMFYAVFRPHSEWSISIPIKDVDTTMDFYLGYFDDEVQG